MAFASLPSPPSAHTVPLQPSKKVHISSHNLTDTDRQTDRRTDSDTSAGAMEIRYTLYVIRRSISLPFISGNHFMTSCATKTDGIFSHTLCRFIGCPSDAAHLFVEKHTRVTAQSLNLRANSEQSDAVDALASPSMAALGRAPASTSNCSR